MCARLSVVGLSDAGTLSAFVRPAGGIDAAMNDIGIASRDRNIFGELVRRASVVDRRAIDRFRSLSHSALLTGGALYRRAAAERGEAEREELRRWRTAPPMKTTTQSTTQTTNTPTHHTTPTTTQPRPYPNAPELFRTPSFVHRVASCVAPSGSRLVGTSASRLSSSLGKAFGISATSQFTLISGGSATLAN